MFLQLSLFQVSCKWWRWINSLKIASWKWFCNRNRSFDYCFVKWYHILLQHLTLYMHKDIKFLWSLFEDVYFKWPFLNMRRISLFYVMPWCNRKYQITREATKEPIPLLWYLLLVFDRFVVISPTKEMKIFFCKIFWPADFFLLSPLYF